MPRRLIINADDFGFTRDVNEGIVQAHRQGILTATTLMANGPAFEHAVALARECPQLDVGGHLVLVGGCSLLDRDRPLPASVPALVAAVAFGKLDVYRELAAQVRKMQEAGVRLTHLDTHKHTILLPAVVEAVARVGEEFHIPWVRLPVDEPATAGVAEVPFPVRAAAWGMRWMRPRLRRVLAAHDCRSPDHFTGFALTGRFQTAGLIRLLRRLPEGTTEFMCHPGHCTGELRRAPTRLTDSRRAELEALTAPEVREVLAEEGIELANYRDEGPLQ